MAIFPQKCLIMSRLADADVLERVCASLGDENEFSDVEFDDE